MLAHPEASRLRKVLYLLCSGVAGAGLVLAGLKVTFLNWVVDVPGWFVSRLFPINFHEGDGAFGFFLAIFLSWLLSSIAFWSVARIVVRLVASYCANSARKSSAISKL